jgi:amino acid transporter
MYGVGLILGAGIYVLIGDIAGIAGNAMWISFIAAAFIALFTGLSYAELSSMFPKSAAEYIFVKNAFNNNLVAFVTG